MISKERALLKLDDLDSYVNSMIEDISKWQFSYTSGISHTGVNNTYRALKYLKENIKVLRNNILDAKPVKTCEHQDIDDSGVFCEIMERKGVMTQCKYTEFGCEHCSILAIFREQE